MFSADLTATRVKSSMFSEPALGRHTSLMPFTIMFVVPNNCTTVLYIHASNSLNKHKAGAVYLFHIPSWKIMYSLLSSYSDLYICHAPSAAAPALRGTSRSDPLGSHAHLHAAHRSVVLSNLLELVYIISVERMRVNYRTMRIFQQKRDSSRQFCSGRKTF